MNQAYSSSEKLAPLVREIAWSRTSVNLERCTDPLEREFYIRMTRKFGWTKSVLIHQIENQSYEKTLLGQTNNSETGVSQLLSGHLMDGLPTVEEIEAELTRT